MESRTCDYVIQRVSSYRNGSEEEESRGGIRLEDVSTLFMNRFIATC